MAATEGTALGLIETLGLVAAIEAADAMLKSADVRLIGREITIPGLVTSKIVGETAAVRSAVDAGRAAAERVGKVLAVHVIPRPDDQVHDILIGKPVQPAREEDGADDEQAFESMTVRELRAVARDLPDFPLKGREIASATKEDLLALLQAR
jgi:microcompartment protein CcmL/EutN